MVHESSTIQHAMALDAADPVQLMECCSAFRNPTRFLALLQACKAVYAHHHNTAATGTTGSGTPITTPAWPQAERTAHAYYAAHDIPAGDIALQCQGTPAAIKKAVHTARVTAVRNQEQGHR